jgi:hypothetical protein
VSSAKTIWSVGSDTLRPFGKSTNCPAVMALEYDGRIPITEEQRIVIRLVKQARAVDRGYRALLLGADVDQLDCGAALEQCLQIRRRQLTNRRRLVCRSVIAQRSSILVRQIAFGQIRHRWAAAVDLRYAPSHMRKQVNLLPNETPWRTTTERQNWRLPPCRLDTAV